jgi:hypothetical protein
MALGLFWRTMQNYETRRILSISNNRPTPKQSLWSNSQHFLTNIAVAVGFQPRWTYRVVSHISKFGDASKSSIGDTASLAGDAAVFH